MKIFINVIIVFLLTTCNVAYAAESIQNNSTKSSQIQVQANVPEKFDKKIYVNFTLEDGTNTTYTLNSGNKYKEEGAIEVGKAKLNFVKIVGDDDNKYSYVCDDNIDIKDSEKADFNIQITSLNKEGTLDANNTNSSNSNINLQKSNNVNNDINNNTQDVKEEEGFSLMKVLKNNAVTIIIVVFGLIGYAVMSRKEGGDW